MSERTVFISYRRDASGSLLARALGTALANRGLDVFLDVASIDAGAWGIRLVPEVRRRAHFLILLTPGAFDRGAEPGDLVRREFELARESGRNIVPVCEESVDLLAMKATCPESMRGVFDYQIARLRQGHFREDVDTLIQHHLSAAKAPALSTSREPFHRDLSRVDGYAPGTFIGRDTELDVLSDAWTKARQGASRRPHVISIVGLGGEGKTSLVAKWAAMLGNEKWPDCEAAFAWSFYSQGTRDQMTASSDLFLKEALTFFGDPKLAGSPRPVFDKARRLAQLVGERRALLILDGLEPLQYGPTSPQHGELKDQGISTLLKALAANNRGLCLVTTRHSVADLKSFWQATAPEIRLSRLSKSAGLALLETLGVHGDRMECEALVEDAKGHALTLMLLGTFLREAHAGDVRKRHLLKLHETDEGYSGPAFRVMDAYAGWLLKAGDRGRHAIAVLRTLGLFDRPMAAPCLDALKQPPGIPDLTETLVDLDDAQLDLVCGWLERASLLTVNRDWSGTLLSLDAHPLIRAYFADLLQRQYPTAWLAGHRRLFEHLLAAAHDEPQPTLEDLEPIYQAVAHGCQAGMQKVCEGVYLDRILRGTGSNGFYSVRKLGAFGANLGALAGFFEEPWSRLSPALEHSVQAWLLNDTAFNLQALGRLAEAVEPMKAGLEDHVRQQHWQSAAVAAGNLSELELAMGAVAAAIGSAEHAVDFADRAGDPLQRYARRATLAYALHQGGRFEQAETLFRKAEALQSVNQPRYPLLYSVHGCRYCDLLLELPERAAWQTQIAPTSGVANVIADAIAMCRSVSVRAEQTLKWAQDSNSSLLDVALNHLSLGRAALYSSLLEPDSSQIRAAASHIDEAVEGLRQSGQQDELPRGLLALAWLRFVQRLPDGAQSALAEASAIAEQNGMKLDQAEVRLYRGRLYGDVTTLIEAEELIHRCGYFRRLPDVSEALSALGSRAASPASVVGRDVTAQIPLGRQLEQHAELLDRLIQSAKETGDTRMAMLLFLDRARARMRRKAYEQARWDFKMALSLCEEMEHHELMADTEIELADLEYRSGLFRDAYKHLEHADAVLGSLDSNRREHIRERMSELTRLLHLTADDRQ